MDVREKLVELIRCADYHPCGGAVRKIGSMFTTEFIEDIASQLIENGVTVQEWISVTDERKPKDRRNYFIAYVFGDSDIHFFGEAKYHAYEGNGIVDRPHFSNDGVEGLRVTHWMEIPKLPQQHKGE